MSNVLTNTVTITSPLFAAPLVFTPISPVALPVGLNGDFKVVAQSPAGKLIESIDATLEVEGMTIFSNLQITQFPIDLGGTLGVLNEVVVAADAVIVYEAKLG